MFTGKEWGTTEIYRAMDIFRLFKKRPPKEKGYTGYGAKKPCGAIVVVHSYPCDHTRHYECRYCEIWVPGPPIRKATK